MQKMNRQAPGKQMAYGCIFCLTGKEASVAEKIKLNFPDICALALRQKKRKTKTGRTTVENVVLFPGYVFFKTDEDNFVFELTRIDGVLSVLSTPKGDWRLWGEDEKFAAWVFQNHGLIDFSKAYREGDRIHIISGPLKDYEGEVIKIDKRNRNGQVALCFSGKTMKVWLGFEFINSI